MAHIRLKRPEDAVKMVHERLSAGHEEVAFVTGTEDDATELIKALVDSGFTVSIPCRPGLWHPAATVTYIKARTRIRQHLEAKSTRT